jgi:DNA-binding XRE family transcriptional regulator
MSYSPISDEELNDAIARQKEWIEFRRKHLFSQVRLAETLGISRRTVQAIEAASAKRPHFDTLRKFYALKAKYE